MVPRKRPPAFDDDDEDGDNRERSGSDISSVNQAQRKRSRISHRPRHSTRDFSDDDDYQIDGIAADLGQQTPPPEQSDDEVELDEEDMAQIVHKRMNRHEDNVASEQGIIEEVYCRNFMCHSLLRIKLGPLINFIIGHNGSGKSAVLTALRVCLGGKAADRGGSLKANIKSGEESATLAVKIKNRGDGAYKPELYGQSITVERQFWRTGRAGFKLKSDRDRIISTKRADLDDILDYFALHLDNPINVLSQEEARKFLSESTPSSKYMFFLKGTQLEALDQDYNLIEEKVDSQEEALRQRVEDLDVLRQHAQDAAANKKRVEQLRKIGERQAELRHQMAWSQVENEEQILERCERDVATAQSNVEEKEREAEGITGTHEGHNQSFEAAVRTVADLETGANDVQETHDNSKAAWEKHRGSLLNLQTQQRTIKDSIKRCKQDTQRLQNEIDQEQSRLANAHGYAHAERMARLEDLKEQLSQAQQAFADHEAKRTELSQVITQASEELDKARPVQRQANESVQSAQSALNRLQGNDGQPLDPYHDSYRGVVRAINRETRWRAKPVGPLGLHVHLLKPEWSSQLETTFGMALSSFAVTCREDQIILSRILEQNDCRAHITIGSASPLDTTGKEPKDDVDTILRVLRIDNDLVRNTLIINHFIEQVVLIQDQGEAYSYMYDSGRRDNVKAVVAFAAQRGCGTRFEYTTNGAQKSGPIRAFTAIQRMKVDREEQLKHFRERLGHAKLEEEEAVQRTRQLQTAHTKAQQAMVRFKREFDALKVQSQRAEDAVEALQNEIDSNRPQDGRLQELESQLEETREELQSAESSFQDSVVAKDRLGESGKALKDNLDEATIALKDAQARIEKAKKRVERLDTARYEALQAKNDAIEAIDNAKKMAQRMEEKKQRQQARVDDFDRQASEICDRVPVERGMTTDKLDQLVTNLEEKAKRIEENAGGTAEELTRVWKDAVLRFREARAETEEMHKVATTMKRALTERFRRWELFRKYISYRAKITFVYLLSERGFRGRLVLDHANKQLQVAIEPDLSKVSDQGRGAESLSGGERSYSTVCLLLSIWEAMGSPIRCLDEFDVCMDSANRATSMSMMIQAARRSVGRQFVLITPLHMDGVDLGDDVQVHRMRDPERGQRQRNN